MWEKAEQKKIPNSGTSLAVFKKYEFFISNLLNVLFNKLKVFSVSPNKCCFIKFIHSKILPHNYLII